VNDLDPGAYSCHCRLQRRGTGRDANGQPVAAWEDVAEVWANIKGQTGMGTITRMQENVPASVEKYSIRIRYREGVTSAMRVLYGDQVFDIRQVRMDFERRVWTDLICELGGNDG